MKYLSGFMLLLCTFSTFSQESEILNVYGSLGYGFGTGGYLISATKESSPATIASQKDHYLNYGQGFKFDLGIQYFMMNNIALQFGIGFSGGVPDIETRNKRAIDASTFVDSTTNYDRSLFGIKTLVVPRFEILELMNMYVGVGLGLFWGSLDLETISTQTGSNPQTEEITINSSPKLALLGQIGLDYPISDLLFIFGEIAFEQMSFTWKKRIVEGGNQPGTYVYEKDAPNLDAPVKVPGSNWQIRLGVRFVVL